MTVSDILKRENNNIDLLRLLAALLVAWSHIPALFGVSLIGPPMPVNVGLGGLGVAVFFFLSGMLVTNSLVTKKKPIAFAWSRFMRIYPAFLVVLLLSVFVIDPIFTTCSFGEYFSSSETWRFLGRNARLRIQYFLPGLWQDRLDTSVNASAWTIPLEVGCYFCVLLAFVSCRYLKLKPWMFIAVALVCSVLPHDWFIHLTGKGYSIIDHVDLFCFTAGAAMALYKEQVRINKTLILALLAVCVMAWRCQNIISCLFPLTVSLTLLYATSVAPLLKFKLKHDISYGLYLWHWPVYQVMFTFIGGINPYLFFVICLFVMVAISYVSARLVEEPCLALGRRLGQRKTKMPDNGLLLLMLMVVAFLIAKFLF